jgi:preprotein translocase subunit SecF
MKPLTFLTTFDFVGNRNIAFLISIVVIVVGLGSIVANGGLHWGIDFVGGTLIEVEFREVPSIDTIRSALQTIDKGNALIQHVGDGYIVLIRLQNPTSSGNLSQDASVPDVSEDIPRLLEATFGQGRFEVLRFEEVGPQIGIELQESAELAILFTFAGLVFYISWRFESKFALPVALIAVVTIGLSSWDALPAQEWMLPILIVVATIAVLGVCVAFEYPFAFAAIVALIHDVLVTVGSLSLTDREITLTVVAALLTIIGYSINDTIVVFDRIRENQHLMRRS